MSDRVSAHPGRILGLTGKDAFEGGLAGMAWEGIGIVGFANSGLHQATLPVLASVSSALLSSFISVAAVLVASWAIFFMLNIRWRRETVALIIQNRQQVQAKCELEKRMAGFGRLMPQVVVETNCTGDICFINGAWSQLFGSENSKCSPPESVFELIQTDDSLAFQQFFQHLIEGKQESDLRFRLQGDTDVVIPCRVFAVPIRIPDDSVITGLRFIFDDISREEKTSQALSQKQGAEDVIINILNSLTGGGSDRLEDSLSRALPPVAELVGADLCLLVNIDADQNTMHPGFSWANNGAVDIPKMILTPSLDDSPWLKKSIENNGIISIPNTADLPDSADVCRRKWKEFGLVSVVILPIRVQGILVGLLCFNTVGRPAYWTASDLRLFEVVAAVYSGARRREADQQNLKAANLKLESIVEFLPDATFVINSKKEVVAWNQAMEELTDIPKEEMLGQGDYAYAVPFYGERMPTLINHFGDADISQWRQLYNFVEINRNTLYAESFVPFLNDGQGALLWLTASALYDENNQVIGAIQSVRDVTYRKKSEQALRNSEERYRRLVETMNDGMGVVSASGMITYVNDSLCQMLGLQKDEMLGSSLESLFPDMVKKGKLEQWTGWQLPSGEALEFDIPRRDGTTLPARISPAAIVDEDGEFQGGLAIFSNLTTIREAEASILKLNENLEQRVVDSTRELLGTNAALRQSEARYRRIIESLQEGYIFYSQDTRRVFTYMSPSYRTLLGFEKLDDLGVSLKEDMEQPVNDDARFKAQKSILGFRQSPWDIKVTCGDGSNRIMEILEVPVFNKAGEVTSVEGIGRDVTEARHNLELIKAAQVQLVEQEKLAALGSLVAGLSHEINTPVGIGVTAASHLSMEVLQCQKAYGQGALTRDDFEAFLESSRESSEMIANNLNRAADLLQNFKLVATDQSAEMERIFNLKEYLQDVVQSISPRLRNTGFHIGVDCPEHLEMKCDPGSLYQILSNLVMNSLTHGFEGMLVGQINISARNQSSGLVIEYADNGNGISRQDLSRIYEPFFTTKRGRGGTGLGMHIVYNNVTQNLGGNISCASKPGRGTRFTITVPLLAEVEHG